MTLKGHECREPIVMLTEDQIDRIHRGTLDILEETGVVIDSKEALDIMKDAGCNVDYDRKIVKFQESLVEESLRKCPSTFLLKARNPEYSLSLGGSKLYFASFPALSIADPETGHSRPGTLKDVEDLVKLCDALPEVHTLCQPLSSLADKPPNVCMEWIVATEMRTTEKTLMGPSFSGCAKWIVEMANALKQQMMGSICVTSPLTYPSEQAEGLLTYARAQHPVAILSGPSLGATGPATLAGALVLENVEVLAGVVLAQLVSPGVGVLVQAYATPLDMRYGTMASGAVEVGMMAVGMAQVWRRYNLPTGVFFPMTDSKVPDEQAAYEKCMQLLLCSLAGINYIMPCGGLDDEGIQSAAQLLIDSEMCGMVGRILDGINVTDETLAIELIKQVGPIPGNYLKTEHTRKWWRKDQYQPSLSSRQPYGKWVSMGSKDVVARATERAREIIKTHRPPPLAEDLNNELSRILKLAAEAKK